MPVLPISVARPIHVRMSCNSAVALLLQRDGRPVGDSGFLHPGSINLVAETEIPVVPQYVEL